MAVRKEAPLCRTLLGEGFYTTGGRTNAIAESFFGRPALGEFLLGILVSQVLGAKLPVF